MDTRAEPVGSATRHEILTQTTAWREALAVVGEQANELRELWTNGDYTNVLFAGCGSTYYLALAAAALFQKLTGTLARGVPAGELVMYPATAYAAAERTLLVAVSRSAETTETLRATQSFLRNQRGAVIVVTNYGERPLAKMGTVTIAIPAGQEESIAQTRSFSSMYVATVAMAATLAQRQDLVQSMQSLPNTGCRLVQEYEGLVKSLGGDLDLDRFYFLGSGPRYGLACEVNLKMKEMSLTHSEPFHFLEFRHGPKSMAGPSTLVIGLLSEANHSYEAAVLKEVQQLGARTLALGECPSAGEMDVDVAFASQLPEPTRNVLYLPLLQLMAYHRALTKGLNPDQPHNLDAVVTLE